MKLSSLVWSRFLALACLPASLTFAQTSVIWSPGGSGTDWSASQTAPTSQNWSTFSGFWTDSTDLSPLSAEFDGSSPGIIAIADQGTATTVTVAQITLLTDGYSFSDSGAGSTVNLGSIGFDHAGFGTEFTGNLTLNFSGSEAFGGSFDNSVTFSGNTTANLQSGASVSAATVNLSGGAILSANAASTITGATINLSDSSTFIANAAGATSNGAGDSGVALTFDNSTNPTSTGGTFVVNYDTTVSGVISDSAGGVTGPTGTSATAATLTIKNTAPVSFGGAITDGTSGTLALTKDGPGTLTLTGGSNFSGGITVKGGVLAGYNYNSPFGTGSITVKSGAYLAGSTVISGPSVTVESGGHLFPGADGNDGNQLVLFSDLNLANGSNLDFWLSSDPASIANDQLVLFGNLTFDGTTNVNFSGAAPGSSYELIEFANLSEPDAEALIAKFVVGHVTIGSAADYDLVIQSDGSGPGLFLLTAGTFTAVPEPSTYALVAGVGALGLALARRRRAAPLLF